MSVCPPGATYVAYIDGELSRRTEAQVDEHTKECARCRGELDLLRRLVAAIAEPPLEAPGERLAERAFELAAVPAEPSWRRRARQLATGAGLLAAAATFVLALSPSREGDHRFQARGGADDPAKWAGLRLFRRAGDAPATRLEHDLGQDDALLVAYDNLGPRPYAWLLIYGVDATGRVHWYHPAWRTEAEDPYSMPIAPGAGIELPDEVRHPLAPGPARIVGLFSREPLRVRDVDRAPERTPPGAARLEVAVDVR